MAECLLLSLPEPACAFAIWVTRGEGGDHSVHCHGVSFSPCLRPGRMESSSSSLGLSVLLPWSFVLGETGSTESFPDWAGVVLSAL